MRVRLKAVGVKLGLTSEANYADAATSKLGTTLHSNRQAQFRSRRGRLTARIGTPRFIAMRPGGNP